MDHHCGAVSEVFANGNRDEPSTRYQQAMDLIDDATRESEICWNQLLGEK
jgi:hypothetical protein